MTPEAPTPALLRYGYSETFDTVWATPHGSTTKTWLVSVEHFEAQVERMQRFAERVKAQREKRGAA